MIEINENFIYNMTVANCVFNKPYYVKIGKEEFLGIALNRWDVGYAEKAISLLEEYCYQSCIPFYMPDTGHLKVVEHNAPCRPANLPLTITYK